MLNVGLIGCGRIAGLVHLPILARLPAVRLAALADQDPQRLREARQHAPEAAAFTDYHDLLDQADVDAVVICLPPALHAPAAIAAFEAGKHVYLEKPIAPDLESAQAILAAWREARTTGMIGFNFRFNPLYRDLRRHLSNETLGRPISARSVFSVPARTLPEWKKARASGGGVLLDLAPHHIDLVRYLFDKEVTGVFAAEQSARSEGDAAALELQMESGLLVQSFFSAGSVSEHRFEVYGERGKLTVDLAESVEAELTATSMEGARLKRLLNALGRLHPRRILRSPGHEPSFRAALAAFAEHAGAARAPSPSLADGYQSLAIIKAAERSLETGRRTAPDDLRVGAERGGPGR